MIKKINLLLFVLFIGIILFVSLRGITGNPTNDTLNLPQWKDAGPLELSPDRGRFALTMSIIEDKSFYFSLPIARFATPDLGYKNGHYVSLFAPGISFVVIPGYVLGKYFGIAQVGTFSIITLFAIMNTVLIVLIAKRLGAKTTQAYLGGLLFIFATPAFTYGVSLYQHHISTFLILLSLYILLRFNNMKSLFLIWFLAALSIPIDYPNLILMAPIGIYALGRIIVREETMDVIRIKIKPLGFLTFCGVIIPLIFFLWFNQKSYGNPFQLAGTVASVKAIDTFGNPTLPQDIGTDNKSALQNPNQQKKSALSFFQTRYLINGFYIHFVSPDRGIIRFTPIIFFGILGGFILFRKKRSFTLVLLAIIASDVLLYSMWGDPWGGWAFGSRYLIPGYAVTAILIPFAIPQIKKRFLLQGAFILLFVYSISVNTLGAITSSANPPQVEVLSLEKITGKIQKYTYERDFDYLLTNQSKSFFFQEFGSRYLTALEFYILLVLIISLPTLYLTLYCFDYRFPLDKLKRIGNHD